MTEIYRIDKSDISINPHELPEEWMKQPVLYEQASDGIEDHQRMRDKAELDLDVLIAQTKQDIRAKALKDGEKVTEGVITERVTTDEYVIKAKNLLNLLNLDFQKAKRNLSTIDMKKKSLENLVTMIIGQFFSVPREGRELDGGKQFEDMIQEKDRSDHRKLLQESKAKRGNKRIDEDSTQEELDNVKSKMSPGVAEELQKRMDAKKCRTRTKPESEEEEATTGSTRRTRSRTGRRTKK